VLPCALGTDYIILHEDIAPLPGENCVMIRRGQGVADARLTAETVAAILRLPINGVPGNTNYIRFL
jgi:hypothetical protein